MLVLTREPGEAVLIGEDIRVVILRSRAGASRIGIQAPENVHIVREELTTKPNERRETNGNDH